MRTSDLSQSKYWRAADVQGLPPKVLIISDITEELFTRGSRKEVKFFLWFQNSEKGLQINKTRIKVLEYAYGPETDEWTGRKVRISYDPTVEFGDRIVGGVKLETERGVVYSAGAESAEDWNERETQARAPERQPAPPPRPRPAPRSANDGWGDPPAAPPTGRPARLGESLGDAPAPRRVDRATGELTDTLPPGEAPADFDDDIPF